MLKPGLWPPNKPRTTESHAEMRVYEALSRQLPSGWYAWHSLRIRVPGHADAEADFVIADPSRGVLILEIKGGRIEQRDGIWFSNGVQLKQAPREQANRFMHELLRLLQSKQIVPPPCGVATCFPDTEFSRAPGQADMAGCVLGAQDLRWLDKALPDAMACALPEGFRPKGKWLQAIHDLWGETWVPRIDFGLKARVEKEDRLRLDAEQFAVLQALMENESVLVTGAAGSGKTVLALAMARKLAESGKKVLLLCFTEPLARWLANQAGGENMEVWAVKRFALDLLRRSGKEVKVEETAAFWRGVSLDAAAEALPALKLSIEAVVLDEGQDLSDDDWMLVEELCRNKPLWAFCDPAQGFWPDRRVKTELFKTRFTLKRSYRCPDAVQRLAGYYLGLEVDCESLQQALDEEIIAVRTCPGPGTVVDHIAFEIDKLKSSGLEASDIAILSLRGGAEPGSIVHRERIGTHRVVRAHDPEAGSNVVVETFLRFKGLERPAVIITDLHLAQGKPDYAKRMYIALTRTLSLVRIIDTREALLFDRILGGMISPSPTPSIG
jgi:chloramphenicol 3-O-phosphotransferase